MTGASSRRKGATGEREFARLLNEHGFHGERTGRNGRTSEDVTHTIPHVHVEVKRCETLRIPDWLQQAERDCGDRVPVVAFRRRREPWRVIVPAEHYLALQKAASESREAA